MSNFWKKTSSEIPIMYGCHLEMAFLCGPTAGSNTSVLGNVRINMCSSCWHIVDSVRVLYNILREQCWNPEKNVKWRMTLYIWTISGGDDIGGLKTVLLYLQASVIVR